MADDEKPAKDILDEALDRVTAGAQAGAARGYLLDYLKTAKENVFKTLVSTQPTHADLMRVWGLAQGIAELERDNSDTISEGKTAREFLKDQASEQSSEQAQE